MVRLFRWHFFLSPSQIVFFLLLLGTTFVSVWLYRDIDRTFDHTSRAFLDDQISMVEEFSENIEKRLREILPDAPLKRLDDSPALRRHLDRILGLFSTPHYRYVYLLYLDEKNRLRYLADGSFEASERGLFRQKFDPESPLWAKAVDSGRPVSVIQKDFTGLWMTHYYPLHIWKSPRTLLVFDISIETYKNFQSILEPIRSLLAAISIALILLLLLSLVWGALFYRQRRKNSIDPLTHLYNRNLLYQIEKHVDLDNTAVILADIDHFKRINDRYGHDVGDRVLQQAARIIQRCTRLEDIAIRYGGEEFLILISHVNDPEKVREIAARIHSEMSRHPIRIGDDKVYITISMGVVIHPGASTKLSDAIHLADKMLYIAKTSGRNRVVFFGEEGAMNRKLLFSEIAEALQEGQLRFYYQPIVETGSRQVCKYEVLARLENSAGKLFLPHEFIETIRGTNLYREMSKRLVIRALEVIERYDVSLSINFDMNDFMDDTIAEMLYDILESHRDLSGRLTIELLEDTPVSDDRALQKKMEHLKSLGVEIAIDDFGKGYATLNYILDFRPHYVKVDRSIVSRITRDPQVGEILRFIVEASHLLGIKVVAEGVEEEAMADALDGVGFDCLQGYHFGRPSPDLLPKETE